MSTALTLTSIERETLVEALVNGREVDAIVKHGVGVEHSLLVRALQAECVRFVEHAAPAIERILVERELEAEVRGAERALLNAAENVRPAARGVMGTEEPEHYMFIYMFINMLDRGCNCGVRYSPLADRNALDVAHAAHIAEVAAAIPEQRPVPDGITRDALAHARAIIAEFPLDETGHVTACGYDASGTETCDCYTLPKRVAHLVNNYEGEA